MVDSKPPAPATLRDRGQKSSARAAAGAPAQAAEGQPSGLAARDAAASALFSVFVEQRAFDDAFEKSCEHRGLEPRDRAFARLAAASVLRHRGSLNAVLDRFLRKALPKNQGRLEPILLLAAAQLLILKTPPHAAISLAVDQCRVDRSAQQFAGLANAVLRKVSTEGPAIFAGLDRALLDIPGWMLSRWVAAYGRDDAHAIADASLNEAPLDLTVKADAAKWAETLGATLLPTGSLRLLAAGRIEELAGYNDGAWWVQDAAAALPALLMGDVGGKDVADLCAAPGGKTAQLALAGANVVAVDKSVGRLKRLKINLARLGLQAETAVADAAEYDPGRQFDAVFVDAPCTATGTIRRHPDILHLKRLEDVAALAELQRTILERAAALVRPGGTLVYCTCSLEPEEGAKQTERFLAAHPGFKRRPVLSAEIAKPAAPGEDAETWITPAGDLRTLPTHLAGLGGMDGFYAARLIRTS